MNMEPNAAVTSSILEAEEALRHAILKWKKVQECEWKLTKEGDDEVEKMAAARGVGMAEIRIKMLEALLGK